MKLRDFALITSLLLGLPHCRSNEGSAGSLLPIERTYIGPELSTGAPVSEAEAERRRCQALLAETTAEPQLPGAPAFEQRRAEILARAKAEPAFFVRAPEHLQDENVSVEVTSFRKLIAETRYPWDVLDRFLTGVRGRPQVARATLLRDGYLYAETPELAHALVQLVRPDHLFGHDEIWIQRGEHTYSARRDAAGRYVFAEGPKEGKRVDVLHLDRIGFGEAPEPLHRDLRSLRYRLHFDRMQVRHVTADRIVANLRYGNLWIPTVLRSEAARVELECEVVAPSLRKRVEEARQLNQRQQRAVQALRQAMLAQIDERLPFDEPRREFGHQLDGKLRKNWQYAYQRGQETYNFNGDRYLVFDGKGRPFVPQVCVDFLTDTLERMSGTWWRPKHEPPGRVIGKLDFGALPDVDWITLRRAPGFIKFAESRPSWFEVYAAPPADWNIRLGGSLFFPHLEEHADRYQSGDIVMIRGKTPWDRRKVHFHSFFIYENDPVTGMPLVIVGNAGEPSIRTWEIEARRTPKRSIFSRIRPQLEWLESLVTDDPPRAPPPLSL